MSRASNKNHMGPLLSSRVNSIIRLMNTGEIRKKYLDFFITQGHKEIAPSSLVPENDPTTLFVSSGMQPLIVYLLGEKHPQGQRLVNSQPAIRLQDIDEVGNNRHTTFFEMLGNWSLGDYFKKDQLTWIFAFLTDILKLDPQRLFVTVFMGSTDIPKDNESITIWKELFSKKNIEARENKRIFAYPVEKNWWSRSGVPENMPPGEPGGPDSEIFYDFRTPHDSKFGKLCHPNCDCGRFMEIGNSVFMEYLKTDNNSFAPLPNKNVDFGGGLERLTAATTNDPDVFKTDLFTDVLNTLEGLSHKPYKDQSNKKAMRIISDHIRASIFLIADGVIPANKTQGYILRRLIRRSLIYARELGIPDKENALISLVEPFIEKYKEHYSYLLNQKSTITAVIKEESTRFIKSLEKGLQEINKTPALDGKIAFKLYETHGFPWEMTKEIAEKRGEKIDKKIFEQEFEKHKKLSRTTAGGLFKGGLVDHSEETTKLHTATHLLHAALRSVLGSHVQQKGSHITSERLRFDFTHPQKLTPKELEKVTHLINEQINLNLPVTVAIMSPQEAHEKGALGFFKDKYREKVKVYTIGDTQKDWFSKEICGGPHVDFTSSLKHFRIIKEEAISSGIRRIYAIVKK